MVPVTINELWGDDMLFSDQDLTLTVDRFGERYVESSVACIANAVDGDLCDTYKDIPNHYGAAGTTPTTMLTYAQAGVELANNGVPAGPAMLSMVVDPNMQANALGFNGNLFNPAADVSQQYKTGKMGVAVGFKWSMDQNIARHTVGLCGSSTPLVNGANQSGNSIITDGWANSTQVLNRGDVVSFSGSNAVNPISYRDTGRKRNFLVTADVTSDGSGNATISIAPDLNADTTSEFQTVTAMPADNAPVYVFGVTGSTALNNISGISTAQALAFHKDYATIAIVKQELPGGMEWSEFAANPKAGLWIRLVRGYLMQSNEKGTRLEVLGGIKTLRPELCCRVSG